MFKYYLKIIYLYSPHWIKAIVNNKRLKHEVLICRARAKKYRVSKDEIIHSIASFDLHTDVILHFSEINIGKICGSKKELSESLIQLIDVEKHTILVAALSFNSSMYDYLIRDKQTTFDVRSSPILTGILNEEIAKREDAKRSLHPTHSVVAIGPRVEYYIGEHTLDETPFGEHSPWFKIIKEGGTILLIGAPKNFTAIHAVEDAIGEDYPFNVYLDKRIACTVIDADGVPHSVVSRCHNPIFTLRRIAVDDFIDDLKNNGLWHSIPVGDSEIVALNAKMMAQAYLDWLVQGKSIYGKFKVTNKLLKRIEQVREELK